MVKSEKGFSLVELAVAAAAAVTIGAIAVTVSTGTSAAISSKARTGKTTADAYNSSVVYNPDVAVATGGTSLVNLILNGSANTATPVPNNISGGYYRSTVYYKTAPASWQEADIGNNPELSFYQPSANLVSGQKYSLSWWARTDPLGNPTTMHTVYLGSFTGGTGSLTFTPTSTWTYYKIDGLTSNFTGAAYFIFQSGGNDSAVIDDVTLVAGPTAQ
jgi:hypothetical protein